jgi:hypothetical protein
MTPRSLIGLVAATVAIFVLVAPAGAAARYGNADGTAGAQLVSADYRRLEQADATTRFAAISGDGRYVALDTFARNFFADDDPDPPGGFRSGGIFRFDLETKGLEKVADGNLMNEADGSFVRRGASNPSISADGRYVAFATAEQLVPADANDNIDVYVRDMTVPLQPGGACTPGPACAYRLASARDGGEVPATYGTPANPFPGSNPGADVSRGVAISADGQKVVFRTEAPSDLPARPTADTPAGQLFVRDMAAQTTTLVTAIRDSGTGAMTAQPAGGAVGAGISADGTTVAWTGSNAAQQTRFLGGEIQEPGFLYYLWRRVADGPTAPTRRVTGIADPDDPGCPPAASNFFDGTSTGPCFGPLTDQEGSRAGISSLLPALSGDGYSVAFLTGSGLRPTEFPGTTLDLFLTDMRPGITRKSATVELTRAPISGDPAAGPPLTSLAMSSGGRYLAITTSRTQFALPALGLLGAPRAVPGINELYMVDLQSRTIERVTHSTEGGDIGGSVQDGVTVSADGGRVAFTSFAGNLFYGDANPSPDAFVATRLPDAAAEGGGPAAAGGGGSSSVKVSRAGPRVFVRGKAKAAGIVVLTISVPAAGTIEAVARGRAGKPPRLRTIAARKTRARGKGSFNVVMRAAPRFRARLSKGSKLSARVSVTFAPAAGGRKLRASTPVSFSG